MMLAKPESPALFHTSGHRTHLHALLAALEGFKVDLSGGNVFCGRRPGCNDCGAKFTNLILPDTTAECVHTRMLTPVRHA